MKMSTLYARALLEKLLSEKELEILKVLLNDSLDPAKKVEFLLEEDENV